ncbi:L-fucose/L-arabinose isomerase family protein [Sulfitobacter sp.]|uniref:L-fucose/L-arabinose isomerase family protein n=1 Tax=Sulfitobacter sp. TaxID=1903071 RepID=UPI003002A35B
MPLTIGLINASLPSYFPQRHGVFEAARASLDEIAQKGGYEIAQASSIPMDATEARAAITELKAAGADFILLLHGGFSMGDVVREIALAELPLGVWATPEPVLTGDVQLNNFVSLNMSMSIARGVRDMARNPVQWYLGTSDDANLVARLEQTLRALSARKALNGARIGVVGGLAPTFYNMEVSSDTLLKALGVWVEHIDMHKMTDLMAAQNEVDVADELAQMAAAAEVKGVSDAQMALTARAALALRSIAAEGGYDALAVSDWPALQENPGMHPGAAFSWLEEKDQLPVASEGDVLGAVTQLAVKSLTGQLGCLLDMTSPDLARDQILMWHGGGGPLHMAKDDVAWINHPMIGRGTEEGPVFGAIADYEFAHGPVTVVRVARHGTAQFVVQGEISEGPAAGFTGCRGWVGGFSSNAGSCTAADIVTTVMEQGLEHHFVLVPGHEADVFAEFASWCGMHPLDVIKAHSGLPT